MVEKAELRQILIPAGMERYDRQLHRLSFITKELVKFVNDKDVQYGSSWRKRGGVGAFFVIARKWDRIEQACKTLETLNSTKYDIFKVFELDNRDETILDDCLDLVGYLLILIEHMIEIGHVTKIEELHMSFVLAITPESVPLGMQKPFGFDEKEDIVERSWKSGDVDPDGD